MLEIAKATEAVQDGRIHIEKINGPSQPRRHARRIRRAPDCAIAKGWLWKHESGAYVKLMPAGLSWRI
jgi:hypothetical protein